MRFTLKSDDVDTHESHIRAGGKVPIATLVHLSLVPGASSSAVQVSFSTPKGSTGCSTVQYWPAVSNGSAATKITAMGRAVTYAKASDTTHHVQLFGLAAGVTYRYTCGCAGRGDAESKSAPEHRFVAPPELLADDASSAPSPVKLNKSWSMLALADLGTYLSSQATVQLMNKDVAAEYEFVLLGGDISYANGNDPVWLTYLRMIEPFASRVPWMIGFGNHELLPHDSGNESGIATTARFAPASNSGSPYWYSWSYRSARFIVISTDSDYTPGSPQHRWLEMELAAADTPEARAVRPWVIVTGHKPIYCSSADADNSRGPTPDGRKPGSAGHQILNGLEALYQRYHVDIVLAGHIHEYERSLPVGNNGTTVETHHESNASFGHYVQPKLPTYLTVGMGGYPHHIGDSSEWPRGVVWSATHKIMWGYSRLHFVSDTELKFEFVANGIRWKPSCNKTGCQPDGLPVPGPAVALVEDTLLITKLSPNSAKQQREGTGVGQPRVRGLQQPRLKADDQQAIHCSPTADSTSILAGAFCRSHTTVTLAAGRTCVSEPLVVTGVQNLTILLEDGAEIQAKRGSQLFGTLLSLESTSGVTIQGGAPSNRISSSSSAPPPDPYMPSATELARPTLKMWRQDYSNRTLYNHSEHRHVLSLHRCSQVTLRNLRFTGSGGDGIYVSGVVGGVFDSLTVDTNFRQGMSIIEAQGLIVVDSVFASTRGTAPMAGIDFVSDE